MALLASFHRERDVVSECFVFGTAGVGPGTYSPRFPKSRSCTMGVGGRPEAVDAGDTPGPGQYAVQRMASDPVVDKPQKSMPNVTRSAFRSTTSRCDPDNFREPTFVPGSGWYMPSTILDNPGPGPDITKPIEIRPFTGGTYERSRPGKLEWKAERAIQAVKDGVRLPTTTTPAIKPLRARGEWNFTGESGDTPDPGEYRPDYLTIGKNKPVTNFDAACERQSPGHKGMAKNPGPGAYDHEPPELPICQRLPGGTGGGPAVAVRPAFGSDVPQSSTAFSSSRLPLAFFSSSWSPALLPGPGTYDPATSDSKQPLSGFKSATDRFADLDNLHGPGPGTYVRESSFLGEKSRRARSVPDFMSRKYFGVQNPQQLRSLRETDGVRLAGFDCSGPQRPSVPSNSSAAPGSYNPEECMGQSISAKVRHCAKIAQGGAFGGSKSGDRFAEVQAGERRAASSPGPALVHQEAKAPGDGTGGAFKSQAPQRPAAGSGGGALPNGEARPGPGTYDVLSQPDYRKGWRIAKTDHVSFGSSAQRFGDDTTEVPPPGAYDLEGEVSTGCYSFKATAQRGLPMPKVTSQGLDPGMYNTAGSLLRKSFNTKVEEAAFLLQIHEKRPPPRGPFPWAEGSTWRPRQLLALEEKAKEEEQPQNPESGAES
eukprot:s2192_g6.t1